MSSGGTKIEFTPDIVDSSMADPAVDAVAESTAKLWLDEATGEMVSKSELKKRVVKRAKKAIQKRHQNQQTSADAAGAKAKKEPKEHKEHKDDVVLDSNAMFKQGFLSDVWHERPVTPVLTRFPPEPNGYLHIGHAKAIAVDFGFAHYHGGKCYLRYDDTNPEKEKGEYFAAILDIVRWLGFEPWKITYSSDYFDQLYEMAEKLVTLGKAYVCHCSDADIKLQRGGERGESPRFRCEHAERTPSDNLAEFRAMRDGKYEEREAFLRMKQDIESANPRNWDLAAYRIKLKRPHHRTGTKWRIYPTYDFTHGICDSFEGITHSLCTTEFIGSREQYEWLNRSLGVYESMQREFGRLNITGTILSKRVIQRLVDGGLVHGWDDPRLFTLSGIRRRGVPPGAVLSFVNEIGVTTAASVIDVVRFEQSIRRYLERSVPRLMLVLDPLPVVIEDLDAVLAEGMEAEVEVPLSPKDPALGSHRVRLTGTVYIERADFREEDGPEYYRLAPGKSVGLLHVPHPIRATSFTRDPTTGQVTEVRAVLDRDPAARRPKTYIQWVSAGVGSRTVEARIYNRLFKSDIPDGDPEKFVADVNPESKIVYPYALIDSVGFDQVRARAPWPQSADEKNTREGVESVRFQGIRVAYFAVDSDTTEDKIVLNRIISLKEDVGKS